MSKKLGLMVFGLLSLFATSNAQAVATCTSKASGSWTSTNTWTCTGTPTINKPDAAAIAIIASPHTVTLNNNYTTAGLTINSGAILDDNGNDLTVRGNVINNGTFGVAGGGGNLFMQTANSTLSGSGTFADVSVNIDAIGVSLSTGSTITLTNQAQVRVGNNNKATFSLNGTINGTALAVGDRVLRVYQNSSMTINGAINAPNAYIRIEKTASITNNGTVNVQYLDSNGTNTSAIWTQGSNAALTLSVTANGKWKGTLFASATGNTVTYNSPGTPFPSVNTYYNLAGTGVICPNTYTILGTSPCVAVPGLVTVTGNPGTCVSTAGIGTVAWAPTPTTNVNLSDNIFATATVNGTTQYLKCTGYGFAIPTNATILGITVNLERKSSSASRTTDGAMRLVKAGVIGTVDRSKPTVYTTADVIEAHGNSADLWGAAWTPADINSSLFGAAFAAKTTRSRTVSVDHLPISVSYSTPTVALHHIQIEHTGAGKTCAPEQLTVKACSDLACTSNFTASNVSGNVTWAGGTLPFSMISGGTGQTTLSLSVTSPQTVTLGTSAISPAPTAASGCTNAAGGTACSLPFVSSSSCWDAVEVGTAAASPIFTKLAGTAFSLDVLNANNYTGTLAVELVNASAGACSAMPQLSTQNVTFSAQKFKTVPFNYANASPNTKVRITTAGGAVSCSTDAFVIRPAGFTVTASANADPTGANVAATPTVAAGANFTLTATAVAGYSGTPTIDLAQIIEHTGAVAGGTLVGVFGAANAATGVTTGGAFTYTEVGYFKLGAHGVNDQTFANLDALEVIPECTLDYSNTLVGGKYGCYIGHLAPTAYFGRFIPHHFMVTPAAFDERSDLCSGGVLVSDSTTPCAPTFSYMGERMDVNFMLIAANASNNPTQNYTGTFAKLNPIASDNTLVWGAIDGTAPTNMSTRLDTSIVASSGTGSFSNGSADLTIPISITRDANADGPYTAVDVGIAPVDSDGVTTIFDMDINNDTIMDRTQVNANSTELRYGRTRITNAYGSGLAPLSLPIAAEYWNGQLYITNGDDDLSSLTYQLLNYQGNLQAGETTMSVSAIAAGLGQVNLSSPGFGNEGSVDVSITAPAYLPKVANGRATFGVASGKRNFIYRGRRGR